jgi:hypothetical protein
MNLKLLPLLVFCVATLHAQVYQKQCVGSPGNTIGAYVNGVGQQCQTSAGAIYVCNNTAGCSVAADWAAQGGGSSSLAIPTTSITGGSANGILYQNASGGTLNQITPCANGVVSTNSSDVPGCSATLPSGAYDSRS